MFVYYLTIIKLTKFLQDSIKFYKNSIMKLILKKIRQVK